MSSQSAASVIDFRQANMAGRERFTAFLNDEASDKIVRQCLSDMSLSFSSVHRGDISKAISHLETARSPSALMVDISGIDMPTGEVHRLAEVCEPGVSVVVVGDHNDVGLYRDLMRAGVSDYLVKPLTRTLVQGAVETLLGGVTPSTAPLHQKLGRVITVMGVRGGVGSSTIAANLAWYLANRQGRRVALVDLDADFGDCGLLLDLKKAGGLREALESPDRIDELFLDRAMVQSGERLFVLTCEEPLDNPMRVDPEALAPLLGLLRKQFHYIVLDVPRSNRLLLQQALELASTRVIVADQTTHSIRDTLRLRPYFEPPAAGQRNLLILNRLGEPGTEGVGEREFVAATGMNVDLTVPSHPKSVIAAANAGMPVADGKGPVAHAIVRIAEELSGRQRAGVGKKWWRFGK